MGNTDASWHDLLEYVCEYLIDNYACLCPSNSYMVLVWLAMGMVITQNSNSYAMNDSNNFNIIS